ncbi:Fe,Mn superoxide dismutase (SOD), C-terminal [Glarea lozoyensis ATCC 20868]|uniref:Fe,Mn superoxide dismutase (SOD), C-terminal n=1 Tax=Glarea lozoyensis (strain ATCC 20868 / MF5171) TaxID=1116229 RepID=S3DS54_GLAL2|nr:Fe,Mn superoxide dismutase (SOD), C-terminal [Glarea lozoyensis ATCC 20868]EPE29268.1 Fe,Mn superoxide dismutase (SOD), C-terminal [Glarea lozoyensis ATCC 20868]
MLRPTLVPRIGRALFTQSRRSIQTVPPLAHDFRNGVPNLLSPGGFDLAWTQYQSYLVEKLNATTAGLDLASCKPKDIILKTARDPSAAAIFNYASMAHNNHFFFSCLSPNKTAMPATLKHKLEQSFSSINTLEREIVLMASSMFGPGFVWLMQTKDGKFSLLNTYLGGTPYPQAHYRQQPVDMNTEDPNVPESVRRKLRMNPVNTVGAHGVNSKDRIPPGATDLTPVLCINTWEHVFIQDYGFGAGGVGGKRAYAEAWWTAIDWNVVAANSSLQSTEFER